MRQNDQEKSDPKPTHILFADVLQPCAFCGCSDLWVNSDLEPKFVACKKCSAFGPTALTVTEAAQRWNKRWPDGC